MNIKLINRLEKKYFDLVWYARKPRDENDEVTVVMMTRDHPTTLEIAEGATQQAAKVAKKYPEEVAELNSDDGDWSHGFNSGMLAALRLVQEMESGGNDYRLPRWDPMWNFPFLDS